MAKKNNCPSLQKSLAWCEGMPSHPGIRRRVYFVNKNLIVAYPKLPRDEFGRPTSAILEGNFELQADAYWQYLDVNIDKSTVTSEPQGEAPSQTQLNKATFFHNGIDEEATAAAGWLNNSDNVYIYEDMPGKFRVLGNDRYRTKTTVNQDQGQGTNAAGTTIQVEVTDEVAPPFYYGTIETVDGTVSMDADIEPKVITESLEIYPGKTKQIEYFPKSDKWTFTSSRPTIATVSNTGLVTALTTATGTTVIACSYDGETVATVRVTVDIEAGDDPGEGGEIGPGTDDPTITYNERTVQVGDHVQVPHRGEQGWEVIITEPDNSNQAFDENDKLIIEETGAYTIVCINGNQREILAMQAIYKTVELSDVDDTMGIGKLLPITGWTATFEQEGVAEIDLNTGLITPLQEGQVVMTLTNGEQSLDVDIIIGDPNAVG